MVFSPNKTLSFEAVVNCSFPCLKEIVTIVVHIEPKVNVVLPDCRMAVDAICRMVCFATRVLFSVYWSWWRIVRRFHPELIFVILIGFAWFGGHGVVVFSGIVVWGR